MLSIAQNHFEIVFSSMSGATVVTLRGPETMASDADCPADCEWLGIRFTLGTFMPRLLPGVLRDRSDANLPGATPHSFWYEGSALQHPTFENADTFVNRLVRRGLIAHDGLVDSTLRGNVSELSLRTAQRHFQRATGITSRTARKIEQARHAARLIVGGMPIADVTHQAGYFDQPHLTRSLTHLIGQTPADIARGGRQLSFLYDPSSARER